MKPRTGIRRAFPDPSAHRAGYQQPAFGGKKFREPNLKPRVRQVAGRNTQRPYGMTGSGAAMHSRYTVVALSQHRVAGVKKVASAHANHVRGTTSKVVAGRLGQRSRRRR